MQLLLQIAQICTESYVSMDRYSEYVPSALVCLIFIDTFQFVEPEDVDRILDETYLPRSHTLHLLVT